MIALGMLPAAWIAVCLLAGPSDGTLVMSAKLRSWQPSGVRLGQVYRDDTGLRPGDVVTAVDGVPLRGTSLGEPSSERHVGDRVTYTYERDGVEGTTTFVLGRYPLREALAGNLPAVLLAAAVVAVAAFVFRQRPRERSARLLVMMAMLVLVGGVSWPLGAQIVDIAGGRGLWPAVSGEIAFTLLWSFWVLFALLVPRPYPWVRSHPMLTAVGVVALPFGAYAVRVVTTGDLDGIERVGALVSVSMPAARLLPVPVIILMLLAVRRTGRGEAERGMRLLLVTMTATMSLFLVVGQLPVILGGLPILDERWQPFVLIACPLVAALAVARYRLFDIELIVRRSFVYGLASAGLLGLYVLLSLGASVVMGSSTPAWVLGGALATLSAAPVRTRLRAVAGRLAFGARDNPYEVISRLGERVGGADAPDEVLPAVVETIAHALRLSYAAVDVAGDDGTYRTTAEHGHPLGRPTIIPLRHGGDAVGRLRLEVAGGVEPFGPTDARLLDDLARQVASAVRLVQLNEQLQRSVERLVRAREAERRRLACDLHDGVGPTLAAGIIQLGVARELVSEDPQAAEGLLDGIVRAAQDLVVDVRRLVDDLRPPALDELGVVAAIEHRAQYFSSGAGNGVGTMHVSVEASGDLESLPPAAEVAAYRIVLEALHNASRHGHADRARVRLHRNRHLEIEVTDDGVGIRPDAGSGVGVTSMRLRARELGGALDIVAGPDRGRR